MVTMGYTVIRWVGRWLQMREFNYSIKYDTNTTAPNNLTCQDISLHCNNRSRGQSLHRRCSWSCCLRWAPGSGHRHIPCWPSHDRPRGPQAWHRLVYNMHINMPTALTSPSLKRYVCCRGEWKLTEEACLAQVHIHALQTAVAVPGCHPLTTITGDYDIEQVTITCNKHVHLWVQWGIILEYYYTILNIPYINTVWITTMSIIHWCL